MPHTKLQEAAQCNTLEVVYITLQGEEGAQEANHEPNPWFWPISEWMSKRTIHVPSWTVLKSNKNKSLAGNVMTVTICNDGKGGQSGLCQVSVIHQKKKNCQHLLLILWVRKFSLLNENKMSKLSVTGLCGSDKLFPGRSVTEQDTHGSCISADTSAKTKKGCICVSVKQGIH